MSCISSVCPIVLQVDEILQASNPGQFDNEGDSIWLKGINTGETTFYHVSTWTFVQTLHQWSRN